MIGDRICRSSSADQGWAPVIPRAVVAVNLVAIIGCGGAATSTETTGSVEQTKADAPKAELKLDRGPGKTQKRRVAISGIATPGLEVEADGRRVISKKNGRFKLSVPLKVGQNRITVYARGREVRGAREDVVVRRTKPPPPPEPGPAPEPVPPPPPPPLGTSPGCPEGFVKNFGTDDCIRNDV